MDLLSAARSYTALARLTTLRTVELRLDIMTQPPSAVDAAALLAALAGLKGVRLEVVHDFRSGGSVRRFRPSDPLQMAGLVAALMEAHPVLCSMKLELPC